MRAILDTETYHNRTGHPKGIYNNKCVICEFAADFVSNALYANFVVKDGNGWRATVSFTPPGQSSDWLEFRFSKETLIVPAGCISWGPDDYSIQEEILENLE